MPVHLECQNCGRAYTVVPSREESSYYCSKDCAYQSKRVDSGSISSAFDNIDEESAYWLGFLFGDGYITKMEGQEDQIGLCISDKQHVEKFKEFLGTNYSISSKGDENIAWRIHIYDDDLFERLSELGITQDKTNNGQIKPFLKQKRDFWRGLVDADGNLAFQKNTPRIRLVGRKNVLRSFQEYLSPKSSASPRKKGSSNVHVYEIHSNEAGSIISSLYLNSDVFLERKKEFVDENVIPYLENKNISYGISS